MGDGCDAVARVGITWLEDGVERIVVAEEVKGLGLTDAGAGWAKRGVGAALTGAGVLKTRRPPEVSALRVSTPGLAASGGAETVGTRLPVPPDNGVTAVCGKGVFRFRTLWTVVAEGVFSIAAPRGLSEVSVLATSCRSGAREDAAGRVALKGRYTARSFPLRSSRSEGIARAVLDGTSRRFTFRTSERVMEAMRSRPGPSLIRVLWGLTLMLLMIVVWL